MCTSFRLSCSFYARCERMILLPISQGASTSAVIFSLTSSRGEEAIIPNITGVYIPLWYCSLYPGMEKMIVVATWQGFYTPTVLLFRITWYDSQYHSGRTSSCDIVSYIQGERMILLPLSQGLYSPPVILFLISRRGEHNITLNISAGVHLVSHIFHNIQDGRGW